MTPANPNFSGDSNDPIHVECPYDDDTPPSIAIVRAIAVIEDVDPIDSPKTLGITLYDHVDPEALDRLVTATGSGDGVTVELTLRNDHRYAVRIRDTGRVVVERGI